MIKLFKEMLEYVELKDEELRKESIEFDGNTEQGQYILGQIKIIKDIINILKKYTRFDK